MHNKQSHNVDVEQWIRDEVVPTFDRVASGQEKPIPASEVFSGAEARYRVRKANTAR
jgi:hypothetical protein